MVSNHRLSAVFSFSRRLSPPKAFEPSSFQLVVVQFISMKRFGYNTQTFLREHFRLAKMDFRAVWQRESDNYINATQLCKAAGKYFANYRQAQPNQEFLEELSFGRACGRNAN